MPRRLIAAPFPWHDGGPQEGRTAVDNPEHAKRLRQTVEVWNTWRGRAGMLLTASLHRAKGMTIPKIAAWVRIAAVLIAAAAVLELLFAIWWWVGLPGWLIIATAIALAPPLVYGAWWLWWRWPKREVNRLALKTRDPKARADVEDNFRKTAGQLIGGAAVLIGAGFALFQFLQQQQAAHDLQISNQVSKGFEQLAGNKTEMRLGGIYALEGVMNDKASEQYHRPVLEALCAFVRKNTSENTKSPPDIEVQATLTVIGRRKLELQDVNLADAGIPGADLSRAYLSGANLLATNLSGANLSIANLSNARLAGANLSGANLSGAYLRHAILENANLSRADLFGSNLTDALLNSANLSYANLSYANLSSADLRGAKLFTANLSGAQLSSANLASFSGLNFPLSKSVKTNLIEANLSGANLSGANLIEANLIEANLSGANLSGANLSGAQLSRANLSGADLKGADLGYAILSGAILPGANLSGAKLTQTQLDKACGDENTKLPEGLTPPKPCPPPQVP
jgi:uncharacterized protein YjbI with pentapeptide repeats